MWIPALRYYHGYFLQLFKQYNIIGISLFIASDEGKIPMLEIIFEEVLLCYPKLDDINAYGVDYIRLILKTIKTLLKKTSNLYKDYGIDKQDQLINDQLLIKTKELKQFSIINEDKLLEDQILIKTKELEQSEFQLNNYDTNSSIIKESIVI